MNLYHVIPLEHMQKRFGVVEQEWQNVLQFHLSERNEEDEEEEGDWI